MNKLKDFFCYVTDEEGKFNPLYILQYATCAGVALLMFYLIN